MAVNDTALLAVQGTVIGQQHVHTLHMRQIDAVATLQGLINAWQAAARTTYRAMFHTSDNPCVLYKASYVCGAIPLPSPVEETETAPNIAGSDAGAGDAMPPFVATVVSERTALSGRSRRGRFYIGGVYETQQASGIITSTYKAVVQAYVDALFLEFGSPNTGDGWSLVVHSPTLASVPGTQCQNSSTLVTGYIVRDNLGTMRSRRIGSGT